MGFSWSDLIVSAIPAVVGGVSDFLGGEEESDLQREQWAREDAVRQEGYAREDKAQALALQLEAIKAKYAGGGGQQRQDPKNITTAQALGAMQNISEEKLAAINGLISALQNPLLSRA